MDERYKPKLDDNMGMALSAIEHFNRIAKNFTSNRVIIGRELYEYLSTLSNRFVVNNSMMGATFEEMCGNKIVIDYGKGRERVFEVGFVHVYDMPNRRAEMANKYIGVLNARFFKRDDNE